MSQLAFALTFAQKCKYVHPTQVLPCVQENFIVKKHLDKMYTVVRLQHLWSQLITVCNTDILLEDGVWHYLITFQGVWCDFIISWQEGVSKLKWSTSSTMLYTACLDGITRVWDARSGVSKAVLTGHGRNSCVLDFDVTRWALDSNSKCWFTTYFLQPLP